MDPTTQRVGSSSGVPEDTLSFYMVPDPEFMRMSKEIGALVLDIQNRGDDCIGSWKE